MMMCVEQHVKLVEGGPGHLSSMLLPHLVRMAARLDVVLADRPHIAPHPEGQSDRTRPSVRPRAEFGQRRNPTIRCDRGFG
jgi:hypothetical protein